MTNINSVLKEVLKQVEPGKEEVKDIEKSLEDFKKALLKNIKSQKVDAEIFVGGSFAKKTVIKKDKYDIDIFIRFDKKHKDISDLTKKLLKGMKNVSVIHGSRDYFQIKVNPVFFLEIVPVKKIKKLNEAENITDLSYSHVRYINKKVKSGKVLDDIRLAKAFCYGNSCYGAESYVNGFSGYALELLVYYYGGFVKFLRAMTKVKDKLVIDIEKHHRSKSAVMMDINAAKLDSPIVLIDPTYPQRNALAALSDETFKDFQKACAKFLKKPTVKAFEIEKIDFEKVRKDSKKKGYDFILLGAKTKKQEGDVAGSKLYKFYKHLKKEISKFFDIKNSGFEYNGKKAAKYFFSVKKKKELLIRGPFVNQKGHVKKFKAKYKRTFVKGKRIYYKKKINFALKVFLEDWKKKHNDKIKAMSVSGLKVVD